MSLPKIIKTIFYVDPSHDRNYKFDVNQNISINEVKGMLVVASNVAKIGLRIFHKQTEKEYTSYRTETLEELFPGKDIVEFIIQIDRRYKNQADYDQLKLGEHCPQHPHKYCFYYCFDCERSLCSLCISAGKHSSHALFEKFDYLKSSDEIVEAVFADLDEVVKNANSLNITEIEEMRMKLKMNYFPSLIEILKKIELKMSEQIDIFNKHYEMNIAKVRNNTIKLKDHCSEGLDELKHQLDIESLLKDEGVFLHFDYKVKELSGQKQRIHDDAMKIDKIIKSFSYAKAKMEMIYQDTKTFLTKQLNSTVYDDIRQKTTEISINEIAKDSVLSKLLSEFKKKNGKIISETKHFREGGFLNTILNSTLFNIGNISTTIEASGSKPSQDMLNGVKLSEPSEIHPLSLSSDKTNLSNILMTQSDNTPLEEENKNEDNSKTTFIMKVVENGGNIVVYIDTQAKDNESTELNDREVKFNPSLHGINSFLSKCAIVNTGKLLYVSGGQISLTQSSSIFLKYDPMTHNLKRLDDIPTPKHSHSLIHFHDFIFSIGGYATNSCERFDLKDQKWVKLANLNSEERQTPILYIQGMWLYAFFGYKQGEYLETIERLNIKSQKSKWENILYLNPENINMGFIGAGIIRRDDTIILLGGKDKNGDKTSVTQYSFTNNTFATCEFNLDEVAYFMESNFIKFEDGDYALFNEKANQLLKLGLN